MNPSSNKIQIPIKTKIAIWWLRIIAGLFVILAFWSFVLMIYGSFTDNGGSANNGGCPEQCNENGMCSVCIPQVYARVYPVFYFYILSIFLPILFFSGKILNGKKWAWILTLAILLLVGVPIFLLFAFGLFQSFEFSSFDIGILIMTLFPLILFLIPALLLVLDRKNYFAAIEKAKNKPMGDGLTR